METVIKVKDLTKSFKVRQNKHLIKGIFNPNYKFVTPVQSVSFEVKRGESIGFLGPNGAGKTTTTKMMTGLLFPTSGEVEILGYKPFDRQKDFLQRIGLVMGNKSGLNWDLNAQQSFRLLGHIYKIEEKVFEERVKYLTELLEVTHVMDAQIRRLSLGERMKMELIGAILHQPEILFLDEPTIGLDITSKKNIRTFLREIQKNSNITLILTSHDMDDIEQVCDRVIVINKGEKVYDNNLIRLTEKYKKDRFVKFVFETTPNAISVETEAEVLEHKGETILYKVDSTNLPKLISECTTKYKIVDIEILSIPLEEMIEDIFEGK